MIKAVVFDMFETLVTLFEGKTYFSENIAADVGADPDKFGKEWHAIEKARSTGKYSIEEGIELVLKNLGLYTKENVDLVVSKRRECLTDTFLNIPDETFIMLNDLVAKGVKIGLITNTFSDERNMIRNSEIFPYFDVALISYEQGLSKPDLKLYSMMAEQLNVKPEECLYVGDGGSKELFAAREAGMHPVQCTWFREKFFEPHVPSPVYDEFDQAAHQSEIVGFIKE